MLNNGIRNIGIRQEGSAHDAVTSENTGIKSNLHSIINDSVAKLRSISLLIISIPQ